MSQTTADCRQFKQFVIDYNIANEEDVYSLVHSPKISKFYDTMRQVISRVKEGMRADIPESYAVIVLIAGRGIVKDGTLMYALNEFDESTQFYWLVAIEEILKMMSVQLHNAYVIGLFACNRQLYFKQSMSNCMPAASVVQSASTRKRSGSSKDSSVLEPQQRINYDLSAYFDVDDDR